MVVGSARLLSLGAAPILLPFFICALRGARFPARNLRRERRDKR